MMYVALKLPLEPNQKQRADFARYAGAARWVFNWALGQWKAAYEVGEKRPSSYDLQKRMTVAKRKEETSWVSEISKHVPEQAIENADKAFKNFFHGLKAGHKVGFPRFKKRGKCRESFAFNLNGLSSIVGRHIVVPKIGKARIARRHFTLPAGGRAMRLTISREATRWFAAILYEVPDAPFVSNGGPDIGVDLGLTTFATLSMGEKIESPKPLRAALKSLKRKQRRLSASERGSHRREKKRRIVARAYARVRNIRQNAIHALTSRLAKNHSHVVIEDLTVRNMMKNHHLAFAIGDAAWGEVSRQLTYKCPRYGAVLIVANLWFPSSKKCSICGRIVKSLPLSVRTWTCDGCGTEHDRDHNAATNLVQLVGANSAESTPAEIGDQVARNGSRCRSLKREISAAKGLRWAN